MPETIELNMSDTAGATYETSQHAATPEGLAAAMRDAEAFLASLMHDGLTGTVELSYITDPVAVPRVACPACGEIHQLATVETASSHAGRQWQCPACSSWQLVEEI